MHRLSVLPLLLLLSCSSLPADRSGIATTGNRANSIEVGADEVPQDLTYYLSRIAGVQVSGTGSSADIQIRGQSNLSSESRPLYVVDGVNQGHEYRSVYATVSPNNIERVTVLKNGDETSLYGLQGANGVIVIETKE